MERMNLRGELLLIPGGVKTYKRFCYVNNVVVGALHGKLHSTGAVADIQATWNMT